MFELRIGLISKSEILCGVLIDTGEVDVKKDPWINFTSLRLVLICIILDFTWLDKHK